MKRLTWNLVVLFALLVTLAGGGVWILYHESEVPEPAAMRELPLLSTPPDEAPVDTADRESVQSVEVDAAAPLVWPEGSIPGELVLSFDDRSELEAFLRDARRAGLTNLEAIPELGMVRVRTRNDDEVRRAWGLADGARVALNPLVESPEIPPLEDMPEHLRAFGDQALLWMGVPDDNADWGEGVRIAVLDTGVGDHSAFANASISHMSVLDAEASRAGVGTHGTSVASLLVGQGEVRGIAPGADVMSVQVLDGDGAGSGFDLARGIMAAVDGGAEFVNLSLGTPTDSGFLQDAVSYAQQRDVVIVASAGNEGAGRMLYPAAYEGVVAVGSVDGNGQHAPFSNRGNNLAVAAPGIGLEAADPDGGISVINGTSFSTAYVTGSLAHLSKEMSPSEGIRVLQDNSNDAGPPGPDGYFGHGVIDWERIATRDEPGIYDVAVADHYLDTSQGFPEVLVSAENRGTEAVGNISLEVSVNGRIQYVPIGTLEVGETMAGNISLADFVNSGDDVEVLSRVSAPGVMDRRPDNDLKGSRVQLNQSAK